VREEKRGTFLSAKEQSLPSSQPSTMSRFFQGSDSDTDSSSSSDDEIYSDQEDAPLSDGPSEMGDDSDEGESSEDEDRGPAARRDKFLKGVESDESDEDEGKRVVKSAKDKRLQEIEATSKAIDNGGKINDWVVVSNGISPEIHADFRI
jgi:translation initiation factor 3 subunit C